VMLSAFCASRILAPIDVPDFNSWFAIMNFLLSSNFSLKRNKFAERNQN